jgi:hypothetical protein
MAIWKGIKTILRGEEMESKVDTSHDYVTRLNAMGFDDLKIAQKIVLMLVEYDLRVNHAHYVLKLADELIDSATSIKNGAVYGNRRKEVDDAK